MGRGLAFPGGCAIIISTSYVLVLKTRKRGGVKSLEELRELKERLERERPQPWEAMIKLSPICPAN